jgi:hypothetical protein
MRWGLECCVAELARELFGRFSTEGKLHVEEWIRYGKAEVRFLLEVVELLKSFEKNEASQDLSRIAANTEVSVLHGVVCVCPDGEYCVVRALRKCSQSIRRSISSGLTQTPTNHSVLGSGWERARPF